MGLLDALLRHLPFMPDPTPDAGAESRIAELEEEQRDILRRLTGLGIRVDVSTRSLRDDQLVSAATRDGQSA